MYLRKLNKILLVFAGLLVVCVGYAQETPFSDYADFVSLGGIYVTPPPGGDAVCPSLDLNDNGIIETTDGDVSSTDDFFINAYQDDMGDPDLNTFEWVVYGGWIIDAEGEDVDYNYSSQTIGDIRYSYVVVTGVADDQVAPEHYESYITVEWDTTNFSTVNAWVAVRQTSEYDCTLGPWRVFTNDIVNNPPSFDANFPSDIDLPHYFAENPYTLPIPAVSDADECNKPLFLSYTVDRPESADLTGDENDSGYPDVQLDEGDNIVTWTVSDGSHEVTQSYTITVEPAIEILNIAWTNPRCESESNGSLLVTDITDYGFSGTIEYSFNGGEYSTDDYINTLGAGSHNVRARVVYFVDADNDPNNDDDEYFVESDPYTCNLSANNSPAFDALPDADITDAGCFTTDDGKIEVDLTNVDEYNNSVRFNGSSFMHINKKYENETLNQFSIATWVKAGDAAGTLLSFDNERYFQLALTYSGGSNATRVRFQTNTEEGSFTHSAPVNDGNWHLIVATFNNGYRAIYIDGVKEEYSAGSIDYVGGGSYARYGMIGARSTTTDPAVPEPNSDFFTGKMAEMAIWEGTPLGDDDVQSMMKSGMRLLGPTDHWVLNDIPSTISNDDDVVYTDLGNLNFLNYNHWARFNGGSLESQSSPKHYYWTNEDGDDLYPASTTLENVGVGDYTLHVTDMFGCGVVDRTYTIENSDEAPPELYWNAAVLKEESRTVTASQSSDLSAGGVASNAVDGLANTSAVTQTETTPWLDIDLGGVFSIRTVNLYANANFGGFWVITSLTPFDDPTSTLEDDHTKSGVTAVEYSGSYSSAAPVPVRIIDNSARYVRIRATGNVSINVAEVEVLSNSSAEPRVLQLTSATDNTDCFYPVTSNDLSIIPFDYDACDGIVSYEHDASHTSSTDLDGFEMPLGDTEITWTATDDKGLTKDITITYRVEDVTPPEFDPWPFSSDQTISYCDAEVFTLPIPTVLDNYSSNCGTGITLELYRATDLLYTYYGSDTETNVLFADLTPGEVNVLEWHATDESGNETVASLNLDVQIEPRVLEVKTSPITCNNAGNSVVTFSRIDTEPGVDVRYILSSEWPDTDPDDEYDQTNDPVFTGIPDGTYYAYVIVNECPSDKYSEDIVIDNPNPIELYTEVTPVECFGQPNGAIDLTVTGGSRTNVLHFLGDDNLGADASNYGAINLAGEGTIEGWIYLDELGTADGEVNYNTNLFGVDGKYGFRIENGQLVFFAGAEELTSGAISQRQWIHVAGTWSATGQLMNLMIDGAVVDNNDALATDFDVPDGGDIYFGADGTTPYHGFIRNVRIWESAQTETDISNNFYMVDPIDVDQNLVANYPINAGGGTSLQNRALVSGVTTGTVNTASYAWQRFAYYWENSAGEFVERTQDLTDIVADDYTVYVDDPLGCPTEISDPVNIPIADNESPSLTFSNDGYGGTPLESGDAIWRYTPEDDCVYMPEDQEFDPVVDDHGCPADDVTVTFEVVDGAFGVTDPAYDPTGKSSLDGAPMTDIIRLRWTAEDKSENESSKEVLYYIIDNEAPSMDWSDQERDNTSGACFYTVTSNHPTLGNDSWLQMTYSDNCTTGTLTNNINGSNTLEGESFDVGEYTISWTYTDKSYPGDYEANFVTEEYTLSVIDAEKPTVNCLGAMSVELNNDGQYKIENYDLDNGSSDNCGELSSTILLKNIAYGASANQSSTDPTYCAGDGIADKAVDGNTSGLTADCSSSLTDTEDYPSYTVDLGTSYSLFGINIYDSEIVTLSGFWVLVSPSNDFSYSGSLSDENPGFNDVTFAEYFEGTVSGNQFFDFDKEVSGQYVQILVNATSAQLGIAELEVFGTDNFASATSMIVDCDDVRYTPDVDPDVQGTFRPMNVLFTVIDGDDNSSSCISQITVEDKVAPIAIAQDFDLYLDDTGKYILNAVDVDNGSADNCEIDRLLINDESSYTVECDLVGASLDMTFSAIDIYGNRSDVSFAVTINDEQGPTLVPPTSDVILELNSIGKHTFTRENILQDIIPDSYDNCGGKNGIITLEADPAFVDCDDLGEGSSVMLTLTATDLYSNISTLSVEVYVEDNIDPVARAKDITIRLTGTPQEITFDMIDNGSYDNCSIDPSKTLINGSIDPFYTPDCAGISEALKLQVFDYSDNSSEIITFEITYEPVVEILNFGVSCDDPQQWQSSLATGGTISNYRWESYGQVSDEDDETVNRTDKGLNFFDDEEPIRVRKQDPTEGETYYSEIANPYLYDDGTGNAWYRFSLTVSVAGCSDESVTKYQNINFFPGEGQPDNTVYYPEADVCQGVELTYDTEDATADSYTWTIENGTPATGSNETIDVTWTDASGTGTGKAYCIVEKAGCRVAYSYPVNILTSPTPSISPTNSTVCPGEEVTYTVSGMEAEDSWTWTAPASGTIIDGGNPNQDFMTIQWDFVITSDAGSISINASNAICSVTESVGPFEIKDDEDPVFDNYTNDAILPNMANRCKTNLVTLSVPTGYDTCDGESVECTSGCDDITFEIFEVSNPSTPYLSGTDLNFRIQELPVGQYSVEWTITDVASNTDSYTRSIIVLDQDAPKFESTMSNLTLYTSDGIDGSCAQEVAAGIRNAVAHDNCIADNEITYSMKVDVGDDGVDVDTYAGRKDPGESSPISFNPGVTRVTVTVTDNAVDENGLSAPNSRSISYLVTVFDDVAPTIDELTNYDGISNDEGECYAVVNVTPPSADEIDDNCSDDAFLLSDVNMILRSDRKTDISEPFEIGTTTITWQLKDEAGNRTTQTQTVTVVDDEVPSFETTDPALQPASITYCERSGYRLPIPTAYDNCDANIESITWTVTGDSYSETGTILASNYPNLKPNGGFTEILADLPADAVNGSDYTVEWKAIDEAGNLSNDYNYTLHVEKQPNITNDAGYLSDVYITALTCGNSDDGIITIANDVIRVEDGATIEYSNDGGLNYQSGNTFAGLPAGEYSIIIRANGCESNTVTAVIPPKADYEISLDYEANAINCWDDETGSIDVEMTGGEPGQILFSGSGSGISAEDYSTTEQSELDLTTQGAIEAWVYLESLDNATLISKGSAYALRLLDGKFTIDVGGTYLEYPALTDDVNLPKTERWYHVTGTWDAGANSMGVYINGEEQTGGSLSGTLSDAVNNNDPVTIGSGVSGIIRDVRIWNDTGHGAIPTQSLVITDETNLVGYWKLQDGPGNTAAHNECATRIPAATDATGVSGWVTDYPQPGFYSWKRYIEPPYLVGTGVAYNDQSPYSNPIHLEDLGRGRYELTFIDQYSCPEEPGLVRNATFVPTDSEIPNIPNIGNQTVELTSTCGTNCDNCQYVVQSDDVHLWPEITDDCYFETTWRVTPYKTNITTTYTGDNDSDDAITTAELELGENRVEVTATQNDGDLVASFTYFITVVDKIAPEAIGQSDVSAGLSNNYEPMGSGIVYYNAAGFNNGSGDNCSSDDNLSFEISSDNGVTWGDELSFTCDDIGSPVQIAFKVIDEAGNEDIVSSGSAINITDDYAPVFISLEEDKFRTHSSCVTVDNDGSRPLPYTIYENGMLVLDASDYSDNCNVVAIDYALEHEDAGIGFYRSFEPEPSEPYNLAEWTDEWKGNDPGGEIFYEGTTYVWFRIVDSSGNISERRIYEVTVLPKPAPQTEIE